MDPIIEFHHDEIADAELVIFRDEMEALASKHGVFVYAAFSKDKASTTGMTVGCSTRIPLAICIACVQRAVLDAPETVQKMLQILRTQMEDNETP